jgi:UPF0755 protein
MSAENLAPAAGPALANEPAPPSSGRRWSPRGAREALQPALPPGPPEPPRDRGGFLAKLSAFLTFLLVLAAIGGGGYVYAQRLVSGPGPLAEDKVVFIPAGSSSTEIAQRLQQEGVIDHPLVFEVLNVLSLGSGLKAGEYQFKQHASLKDVRDILVEGKSILHSITIPEGLTSEQIVQRLREKEELAGEIKSIPREGSLLPDTYRFPRGYGRDRLIAQMERAQRQVLNEVWSRRSPDLPLKSPTELLILASIVEKETGRADERTRVASVFVNRLNRGMRLESDPTIIYGIVGGRGSLGRPILASEIRQATPYNTYVINGLPPGPIANPGRASIEASANPSRTRDIFFVADGTGGHAFAETLEQHNRNVARWRQIEGGANAPSQGSGGAAPSTAPAPAAGPRPGQRSDAAPTPFRFPPLDPSKPATPTIAASARPAESAPTFVVPSVPLEVFGPEVSGIGIGMSGTSAMVDPTEAASSSGPISFPIAPGRRQAIQRAAQQAGAAPATTPPQSSSVMALAEPEPAVPAGKRPRAFDASEGTDRDPLRNRSFDLNSAKTVPVLR